MNNDARVLLWGNKIGALTWVEEREIAVFQYMPDFIESGIQLSPLMMPLNEFPYEFPALEKTTFKGLPGLLADSLPDRFGNAIINEWLAMQGRSASGFNSLERLCYVGNRGMGALEFKPSILKPASTDKKLELNKLVDLASRILDKRSGLSGVFSSIDDRETIENILRVGTSAGGARAKAVLAWNPKTKKFRSGQINLKEGFEHWLMKFDGIRNNRDKELADPKGYGKIEYAYYLMAVEAGIHMSQCRLHHEGSRSHFMTRRFDRSKSGNKRHMQTLCAMAHYDYNQPTSYSYEQSIQVIRRLDLPREDIEQQVIRAFFNVIARNQDDHVKNISFLMDREGVWRLSPAYDITYAWDPKGEWTSRHQMSINGKRDHFTREDLLELAKSAGIKQPKAQRLIDKVAETVRRWTKFADKAGVKESQADKIRLGHRTTL